MNVGLFIRVSTLDQVNNTDSVETHIERGKLYAKAKGWKVVKTYNLAGVSGKSTINHKQTIEMFDAIVAYPNPTKGTFEIALPDLQKEASLTARQVTIELYTIHSQLISIKTYPIIYGKVQISLENKPTGLYIAKVHLDKPVTLKIIKQ